MKIATWNISAGINTSNYTDNLFDKNPEVSTDDKCLQDIAKLIIKNNIDVIALQEVTTTNSFSYMEKLSELTGLKYFEKFENSEGFLIKDTKIGLAILSKFPIKVERKEFFNNPKLVKKTENGTYTTHDKAWLAVKVNGICSINLVCSQFLPFHRFNADALNYKHLFSEFDDYVSKNASIVCADFNVISGQDKLNQLLTKTAQTHTFIFNEITTTDKKHCDNIAIPNNLKIKNACIDKSITPSDHFLCIIEI